MGVSILSFPLCLGVLESPYLIISITGRSLHLPSLTMLYLGSLCLSYETEEEKKLDANYDIDSMIPFIDFFKCLAFDYDYLNVMFLFQIGNN